MNSITFNVKKVFAGSEKQQNVGIYATFNMTIEAEDGILVSLNDMKLCKSKAGKWYVQSPYRSYEVTDKESHQKTTRRIQYAKLWPEEKNWGKQDMIVDQVRAALEENANKYPPKTPTTQADTSTTPNTSSSSNAAW